ncbi:MAG: hypothetical protein ACTHMX_11580 [Thermomicrobiales bacterium]
MQTEAPTARSHHNHTHDHNYCEGRIGGGAMKTLDEVGAVSVPAAIALPR